VPRLGKYRISERCENVVCEMNVRFSVTNLLACYKYHQITRLNYMAHWMQEVGTYSTEEKLSFENKKH
jgi:hypothetical protein